VFPHFPEHKKNFISAPLLGSSLSTPTKHDKTTAPKNKIFIGKYREMTNVHTSVLKLIFNGG
jgi:hypothetical protein